MKKLSVVIAALMLGPGVAFAQQNQGCTTEPYCVPQAQPEYGPPPGRYVGAPETGEYAGESSSLGIRGFGIRIPETVINLPTIQLPSFVRYRRNPELLVESSRAPYREGPAVEYGQISRDPEAAPGPEEAGPGKDYCTPGYRCTTFDPQTQQLLDQRQREVQKLSQEMAQLQSLMQQLILTQQQAQQQNATPTAYSTPATGALYGQGPAVSYASQYMPPQQAAVPPSQWQHQYELKCQEVELLNQKLERLERLCHQLAKEQEQQLFEDRRQKLQQKLDASTAAHSAAVRPQEAPARASVQPAAYLTEPASQSAPLPFPTGTQPGQRW